MKAQPLAKIESSPVAIDDSRLREMATAIDAQFAKAKPAMAEIVKLWGMIQMLQEEAKRVYSHVTINPPSKTGGRPSHPWDLKVLFAKYLPNVEQRSAYRLFACGEFIARKFEVKFLPQALQRKIELPKLAASTPKELEKIDRRLPKKQKDLFSYAEGGSQKSWLDQFAQTSRGGNQYERGGEKGKRHIPTEDELRELSRGACENASKSFLSLSELKAFHALNGSELRDLLYRAECVVADLKAFQKKPAAEREMIFKDEVFRTLKHYAK